MRLEIINNLFPHQNLGNGLTKAHINFIIRRLNEFSSKIINPVEFVTFKNEILPKIIPELDKLQIYLNLQKNQNDRYIREIYGRYVSGLKANNIKEQIFFLRSR